MRDALAGALRAAIEADDALLTALAIEGLCRAVGVLATNEGSSTTTPTTATTTTTTATESNESVATSGWLCGVMRSVLSSTSLVVRLAVVRGTVSSCE